MDENITIGEITKEVSGSSDTFEKTNNELKRKYILLNIEAFNLIAKSVSGFKGSFGTGYPFYVLDENLKGKFLIIMEQLRYNRQLIDDGNPMHQSIYKCKQCLDERKRAMPDLKLICKPCPKTIDKLKPRKLINRLPDLDMWFICEDGKIEEAEVELARRLKITGMRTSDVDPFKTIDEVNEIAKDLEKGKNPKKYLPIDTHIIEYSVIKDLIEKVPKELSRAKKADELPYLPIFPVSYRKKWQNDDEAYNYIYDFLSAFTPFNIPDELRETLEMSRKIVAETFTNEELYNFVLASATPANKRRFIELPLEEIFENKMDVWRNYSIDSRDNSFENNEKIIDNIDDEEINEGNRKIVSIDDEEISREIEGIDDNDEEYER